MSNALFKHYHSVDLAQLHTTPNGKYIADTIAVLNNIIGSILEVGN